MPEGKNSATVNINKQTAACLKKVQKALKGTMSNVCADALAVEYGRIMVMCCDSRDQYERNILMFNVFLDKLAEERWPKRDGRRRRGVMQ